MTNAPEIVIMTDAEVERFASEKDEGLGGLLTAKGPLPLKALDVQAGLEGLTAEVVLTQTFVNTHAETLEATYIFPLPDRAAVTHFRMEVAGRVVEGVLKERAEARREYDEAIEAGHRAAITEEERPGVFTMRVGNLPAGEVATVRLTMVGPLIYDAGEVTFRFPLVVAPRYIPGNPLEGQNAGAGVAVDTDAVPDASRITPPILLPGYPNPVQFSMAVNVHPAGWSPRDLRASLHAVINKQLADGTTRISVQPGDRLNRDFILRYTIAEDNIQTSLTLVPDAAGDEGTFALTVVPPVAANPQSAIRNRQSRAIVFVLDRSGSMEGWKMVAARRALGRMIDSLTERDSFTVLAFDEELEAPALCGESLVIASDRNRFRVIEWLAHIDARGGTELAPPLEHAVSQLADSSKHNPRAVSEGNVQNASALPPDSKTERVLVLLTDGQVGNEDQILQALGQRLKGIRIFTLGIDRAVNEAFLRRLAVLGGGSCDVVESEDRLDEVMTKVQRRIGAPVLTGLQLDSSHLELEVDSLVPGRLPDLFAGAPLTVLGRYRGTPRGAVTVKAIDDAGRPVVQTASAQVSSNKALAHLWARGRLRDLEDIWVVGGHAASDELQKHMVALSLKFGVLCRFTAFVAVDRSEIVNQGGTRQRIVQPVEFPDGWEMPGQAAGHGVARSMSANVLCKLAMPGPASTAYEEQDGDFADSCMMEEPQDAEECNGSSHFAAPEDEELHNAATLEPAWEEAVPVGEIDLTAYRRRAEEILKQFQADGDKEHALGVLIVKLQALVDDLRSIGAGEAIVEPLARLLEEARISFQPSDAAARAEQVLRAFTESLD